MGSHCFSFSANRLPTPTHIQLITLEILDFYCEDDDIAVIIRFNKQTAEKGKQNKMPRVDSEKIWSVAQFEENTKKKQQKTAGEIFPHSFSFASCCWLFSNCVTKETKEGK